MKIFTCTAVHVRVMENLESHGIFKIHFPGLESHGILIWMEDENYCIKTWVSLLLEREQKRNSADLRTNTDSYDVMFLSK